MLVKEDKRAGQSLRCRRRRTLPDPSLHIPSPVKNIPQYLKLHREDTSPVFVPATDELTSAEILCSAFEHSTGWHLRYEPPAGLNAWSGSSAAANGAGLVLTPARRRDHETTRRLPRQQVEHLAAALAIVLGELDLTRRALAQREAELAAGVPITKRSDEEQHLLDRLETALASGMQAVGGQGAALYVLDENTSELKLRACVGLPPSRLLDAARPLRGALADLEALLGHAVVIENTADLPHWHCPEDFASAVCVPVSSPSTPLGTLWIFGEKPRDYSSAETNMIEVIAGRIAADLEREMLLSAGEQSKTFERQLDDAVQWQEEHLPSVAPVIDDWQVAGATEASQELASEFFDWSVLNDGRLAVAVGDAHGKSVAAGLSTAVLQGALKAHSNYRHEAKDMLQRVNETLWTSSPGGQFASLGYGLILPEKGQLEWSSAGRVGAVLVEREGHLMLTGELSPLGAELDVKVWQRQCEVARGGALVLFSDGVLSTSDARGALWNDAAVAEFVRWHLHLPAKELLAQLQAALGPVRERDRTLLIVKRLR